MPFKNGILIHLFDGKWRVTAFSSAPVDALRAAYRYTAQRNQREGR